MQAIFAEIRISREFEEANNKALRTAIQLLQDLKTRVECIERTLRPARPSFPICDMAALVEVNKIWQDDLTSRNRLVIIFVLEKNIRTYGSVSYLIIVEICPKFIKYMNYF